MEMIGKHHKTKNQTLYKRGLVFGTFDPLHYGHIRLLKRAKRLCEKLYVCTEDNETIRKEKDRHAFTAEAERLEDLAGIKYVDGIYMRGSKTRRDMVDRIKPDVLFLGSDWKDKDWEGKHFGIKIEYLERTHNISSTLLRSICH